MTETVFRLKRHLTSFQIMILGFAGVILLGALVLMLPIATVQRVWTPFHEALFTSTSAVCVTGLVVQDKQLKNQNEQRLLTLILQYPKV